MTAHFTLRATPIDLSLQLDSDGYVRAITFPRWGDPEQTGRWAWHPFGGEITAHRTFNGLTVPSAGRVNWNYGNDRWSTGELFRFEILGHQSSM